MTEEFWADYKRKKDRSQTNLIWKNVKSNLYMLFLFLFIPSSTNGWLNDLKYR